MFGNCQQQTERLHLIIYRGPTNVSVLFFMGQRQSALHRVFQIAAISAISAKLFDNQLFMSGRKVAEVAENIQNQRKIPPKYEKNHVKNY